LNPEEKKKILTFALKKISARDFSEKELLISLKRKFPETDDFSEIIDILKAKNYLNDKRFAENLVKNLRSKKKGIMFIKAKLREKGISESIISKVLEENSDELTLAKEALLKKFGKSSLAKIDKEKLKVKILRFLISRGFEKSVSFRATEEFLKSYLL